jgi:hypothetical protein
MPRSKAGHEGISWYVRELRSEKYALNRRRYKPQTEDACVRPEDSDEKGEFRHMKPSQKT